MSVIGELFSGMTLVAKLLPLKDKRRSNIANLMLKICDCIDNMIENVEQDSELGDKLFAEFSRYCSQFADVASDVLKGKTLN